MNIAKGLFLRFQGRNFHSLHEAEAGNRGYIVRDDNRFPKAGP